MDSGVGRNKIIRARSADLSGIRKLHRQEPGWSAGSSGISLEQSIVAVDPRDRVVGWLMGNHRSAAWLNIDGYKFPDSWECSYITWLLVDENYRSQGIGSQLLSFFVDESRLAGNDTIVLSPSGGDDEAGTISFYEKNGFRRARSGQMHRGPHGPRDSVPLEQSVSEYMQTSQAGDEAIREYKRRLGVYGYGSDI